MSDLIDRQLVLKAIDEYERLSAVSQTVRNMTSLREIVEQLPSAQPDVPDTNVGDTISRQNAIDEIRKCRFVVDAIEKIRALSSAPQRTGRWIRDGEQMIINLENAREQYAVLGYPHRKYLKLECSVCKMLTLVDSSIKYEFCPHCGARMEENEE